MISFHDSKNGSDGEGYVPGRTRSGKLYSLFLPRHHSLRGEPLRLIWNFIFTSSLDLGFLFLLPAWFEVSSSLDHLNRGFFFFWKAWIKRYQHQRYFYYFIKFECHVMLHDSFPLIEMDGDGITILKLFDKYKNWSFLKYRGRN